MNSSQIRLIQQRIGVADDGFWGPVSIRGAKAHLRGLMPEPHPFPKSDQASLSAFYGERGDEGQLTNLPVPRLGIKYAGQEVRTIRCHHRLGSSLLAVLHEVRAWQDAQPPLTLCDVLGNYDGCYNNRLMRNGSTPSLHARGAAIDFWAGHNGNATHWPQAALMPFEVIEIFARHGWLSGGAFWGRDAMHFQATQHLHHYVFSS
jgi:hypothetical protein